MLRNVRRAPCRSLSRSNCCNRWGRSASKRPLRRSSPCKAPATNEKQFHLPAVLIDGGDGRRAEGQQVGEEHDGLLFLRVPYLYPPEQHWLLSLPLQSGKADDLVAHHVAVLWNLQFFFPLVNCNAPRYSTC